MKNPAGVEVIINMSRRIEELQQEIAKMREQHQQEIEVLVNRIGKRTSNSFVGLSQ